ncbi:MAG TPA: GLUG motif-containing protein [Spirochaetota bacterium]|nr:GLUG motif-containing protein [Spirochaetota bacterium]
MKKFFSFISLLFVTVLFLSACDDGGGGGGGGGTEDPAPGAVTMTMATIGSDKISLLWEDPVDSDLASIEVGYKEDSQTDYITETVDPGDLYWDLQGLSLGIGDRYAITVAAIDAGGNETTVSFKMSNAGNQNNYYFIYTDEDLYAVRGGVTGYEDWDTDAAGFVLMADLSLASYDSDGGWEPIGDNTGSFGKVFEGNGHVISGLGINRPDGDYQGLFGYLGGPGIINDLTVQGTVSGRSHVGGLVGTSEGTISGCVSGVAVTGNVSGEFLDTGGLVGDNSGAVSVSSATGSVDGIYRVGGLIGFNDGGTVDNCHASGAVTTTYDFAGGLVGRNAVGTISDSYATGPVESTNNNAGGLVGAHISGSITNCYATGSVSSPGSAGGLVGGNGGNISSSHATGNVTGESNIGGLIGNLGAGTVGTCHATGAVTGTGNNLGGLVGYFNMGEITGSYATGSVTGHADDSDYVGGLVGGNNEGEITGYHTTGAVTGHDNVGGLVGYNSGGPIGSGSYSEGSVTGNQNVGGLMGYLYSGSITGSHSSCTVTGDTNVGGLVGNNGSVIELSYATGSVTATAGTNNDYAGGLVGYCDGQSITNCYARGSVTGVGSLGGFIGRLNAGTVSNCYSTGAVTGSGTPCCGFVGSTAVDVTACYYDIDTSGLSDSNGGAFPTYTDYMMDQQLFDSDGWDFDATWSIDTNTVDGWVNNGYPYLLDNEPAE